MLKTVLTVITGLCLIGAVLLTALTRKKIKTMIKSGQDVPKKLLTASSIGYALLALALVLGFSLRYVK